MEDTIQMNTKGLDALIKAFKKPPVIRVGILGDKNHRSGKVKSNSTVGAAHEYGTTTIPQRSFLRIPLTEQLPKYLENAQAFDKEVLADVVRKQSILSWMQKIGVVAERVVLDAFGSGGFGRWKALKPETMKRKKNKQILVETQQLRNSITYEVKE